MRKLGANKGILLAVLSSVSETAVKPSAKPNSSTTAIRVRPILVMTSNEPKNHHRDTENTKEAQRLAFITKDFSMDAVLEHLNIEINQQPQSPTP
jgi:rRNA maturation endonuclease Nob1